MVKAVLSEQSSEEKNKKQKTKKPLLSYTDLLSTKQQSCLVTLVGK